MVGMTNTGAYVVWRSHSQQMLDFAVLVTTAAPQLDHALKGRSSNPTEFVAKNPIFRPSKQPYSTEIRALPDHQHVLGATLVLSIFSYFETYFFSVLEEIISFHGGIEKMEPLIRGQLQTADGKPLPPGLKYLRKLFKPAAADRYRKYTAAVGQHGIMWPSQRFMLYGFKQAVQQRKRWRSADIPDLVTDLLGMQLSAAERDRFHNIRVSRNKVAHGKALSYDLKKAISASNFFLEFSRRIEDHVLTKFMIIERYAH